MVAGFQTEAVPARLRASVIIAGSPGGGKAEEKDHAAWTGSLAGATEPARMGARSESGAPGP
jgi:hypothetical protein